jgi:hypothetical protein
MDHLLIPDGAEHIITVPYKCAEPYDNGDFLTYPNWPTHYIRGENGYGGREPKAIESFLQMWLYFGCLVQVFKLGLTLRISWTRNAVSSPRGSFRRYSSNGINSGRSPRLPPSAGAVILILGKGPSAMLSLVGRTLFA